MKSYYFLIIGAAVLFVSGLFVLAQELPGVTFPIPELGNCANKAECEVYCDKPENMPTCLDFGEAHGLISPEEAAMARKMLEMGEIGGPGDCKGKAECEVYCDNPDHMEECIIFAKKYGLIPPDELEDVEKVLAAIKKGAKPPACHGKAACDTYCNMAEHFEECITFGEAAGLIPPDEIEDARKALEAVKKGIKPPACKGEVECDEYCAAPEHLEECLTFAEAAGFMTAEEAVMARRTGGKGPGGCRGKAACDAFCEDPSNMEECINFGEEFGFMSHEEAEQARKMLAAGLTGGPGGCKGKEECDAYCNDLSHMEECVDFAERAGFMTPEDAARARQMAQKGVNVMAGGPGGCKGKEECQVFCEDPANMEECLNFAVQIGEMTPEQAEQARQGMEMMQRGGPGGCKSEAECKGYCQDPTHAEECINFAIKQGIMSPEEAQQIQQQMQQMMPSEGMQPPEGIPLPPEGMPQPPSPEEIQQIQEQMMEQQIQEQMQQMMPPPEMMPPEGMMPSGGMPQQPPPPPPGGAPPPSGGTPPPTPP